MSLLEGGSGKNGILTVVFVSLFLISLVLSHNAFADSVVATIDVGSTPFGIGVNNDTNMIYVSTKDNTVSVIDGATNSVTGTIPVGNSPGSVGVNPNTNMVYVNNYHDATVSVIDGTTNSVTSTIPVGFYPTGIGVNPITNKIYVANHGTGNSPGNTVSVIDGTTNSVTSTIPVGFQPYGIGVNPITNKIYVTNFGTGSSPENAVSVIDGATNSVTGTISVGSYPVGVGVNPNTNMVYVSNSHADTVSVIDGATNSVTSTIPVGFQPGGVGVNPITNKIYVTNFGTGSSPENAVSVIDGATNSVTSTIPVGSYPDSVGVNPNTNMIYVANYNNNTISVINGSSTSSKLTVNSQDNNGNAITGFYTVLSKNGNQISSGFTPVTFTLNNTQAYTVHVGDFGKFVFNHWSDTGSTSATRDITMTSDGIITAVYKTVPQPPTGLAATAASSSQINLSWTAPGDNGGSAVTGYMIERSADNGSTWSTVIANTGNTGTTYADTGLQSASAYTYRVSAINSVGTSPPSNTVSATTSGNTIASGIALNNVQSTSGTTSTSNQITLSGFSAGTGQLLLVGISANSNSPVSVTFNGVHLTQAVGSFYNNDAEFWYLKNSTGTGDIIVTMGGPTQAVVGAYSFSGVNQADPIPAHLAKHNTTPNSPNISITTKYANDWVLDLSSIYGGEKLGSPTCTQQWNVNMPNAITGASSSAVMPSPGTVTCKWTASSSDMWDDVAVEIGSYTSGAGTGNTATAPSSPTGLTATSGNAQVALSWIAPASNGGSSIINYNIYRGTSSGSETLLATAENVTSYNDNTVTNGHTYFYYITAINSTGQSSPSNEVSVTPMAANSTSGTIPRNGLLAEWNFENNTLDSSGNRNDGATGPLTPVLGGCCPKLKYEVKPGPGAYYPGRIGLALGFNGSVIDRVSNSASLNFGNESLSISGWIKTNQTSSFLFVDHRRNNDGVYAGYSLEGAGGTIIGRIRDSSGHDVYVKTGPVNDSLFHHVAFVVDRSTQTSRIYLDDKLQASSDISTVGSINQNTIGVDLGYTASPNSPDSPFVGLMDQVRVYNRALTDNEIQSLFLENPSSGQPPTSGGFGTSGITLNNAQSTSGTTSSSNQITLSSFNVGTASNQLLLVGVSANSNNVGSITFAGVPLAREVSHFTNNDAEFWYLTNPAGTGDITVTMNGPTQAVVGAYSFSGVNQTVPIPAHITRHNLTPSSPAISITTSHPNDLVLDLPSIYGGSTLGSPTCTQQWNVNVPGQITGASSSIMVPSPATVTCSWTASSDNMWDDAAIEIGAAG